MSQLTKDQLQAENQSNFPNNNTGFITATRLREFNSDMIDSLVDEVQYNADSASFSASIAEISASQATPSIRIEEEGSLLGTADTLNFVGDTITASIAGGVATINVNASQVDLGPLNQFTASADARLDALETETGSLQSQIDALSDVTGGFATTSSLDALSSSLSTRLTNDEGQILANAVEIQNLLDKTGSYATTGSNVFKGSQTISGSVVVEDGYELSVDKINTNEIYAKDTTTLLVQADLDLNGDADISGNITASGARINGNVFVDGDLTARTLYIDSSSILYTSGSNKFGDSLDDVQELTGSVSITGSLTMLEGVANLTSSWAENAITSSYALTASYVENANTSSYSQYSANTIVYGKNLSGGTIIKGTPLYFTGSGTMGNLVGVYPADAGNPARMPAGGVAGEAIANGDEGIVLLNGFINGVDTTLFNSGDEVYVGVGGGYTNERPTGSANLVQALGYVERVSAMNGSGVIHGPGNSYDLPNIQSGYLWVGDSDGVPQQIPSSSLQGIQFPYTGSAQITGSLGVTGSITLQEGGFSGSVVDNITDIYTSVAPAKHIITLTSASYASLVAGGQTDPNTLYFITGSRPYGTDGTSGTSGLSVSVSDSGSILGNVEVLEFGGNAVSVTLTDGTASVDISTGSAGQGVGFPFTGSAQITGSFGVTGSISLSLGSFSGSVVDNITDTYTAIPKVDHVVTLTAAEYAGLGTKDPNTLYIVSGSTFYGTNGTSGTSGADGTNGTNGVDGSSGTSGADGTNGTNGVDGTSGVDGSSGTSGVSGVGFPYTGSAQITGSLGVTGSINISTGSFSGSVVDNIGDTYTSVPAINHIVTLTQAEYDGLGSVDGNTLYVISGSIVDDNVATASLADEAILIRSSDGAFDYDGLITFFSSTQTTGQSLYKDVDKGLRYNPAQNKLSLTGSFDVSGSLTIVSQSFTGDAIDNITPTSTGVPSVKHVVAITSASYAALGTKDPNTLYVISGSAVEGLTTFPYSGSAQITGSMGITGSLKGNFVSMSIASSTASMDVSAGNFFVLGVPTGTTHLVATNVQNPQTINMLLKTVSGSIITFGPNILQPSGSFFTASSEAASQDVLSFIAFDTTSLYLVGQNNFI